MRLGRGSGTPQCRPGLRGGPGADRHRELLFRLRFPRNPPMLRIRSALLALFLAACAPSSPSAPSPTSADLLVRGGTVYDGSGGKPYSADIVIAGDSIVAIDR